MPEKLSRPVIPEKRQLNANRFARISRLLSFFKIVLFAAFLVWLILGGISAQIVDYIALPQIPLAAVYTLLLIVVYGVLSAPFDFVRGFVLARRYGLSVRSFGSWLAGYIQFGLLSAILVTGVVAAAYWAISYLPDLWWATVWGILMVVSLIFNLLLPGVLIPMFYKTQPFADEDLVRRFSALACQAGLSIKRIYKIEFNGKQTTANAALTGIGRAKRILLSDTLLADYSAEEIEAVIAHELGHLKNHDGTGIFLFQALIIFACLWITAIACAVLAQPLGFGGIGDISMLPLALLVFAVINMVFTPVSNAVMRSFEMAADDFAIRLTQNPAAFISMLTKLMSQNLGEVNPPLWVEFLLYDHPGYYRRLSYARGFMRSCN
jgi:STE24 endopeptidase